MNYDEVKVENIDDEETIECIQIFDEEMKSALNKIPELSDISIDKFVRNISDSEKVVSQIQMHFSKQALSATIPFEKDFFDDYCYSTRKERDALLKNIIDQIKNQLR